MIDRSESLLPVVHPKVAVSVCAQCECAGIDPDRGEAEQAADKRARPVWFGRVADFGRWDRSWPGAKTPTLASLFGSGRLLIGQSFCCVVRFSLPFRKKKKPIFLCMMEGAREAAFYPSTDSVHSLYAHSDCELRSFSIITVGRAVTAFNKFIELLILSI